jgi:DNA polymerase I
MRVVIDTECNSLANPSKVWLVVCKDIDKGELHVFRNVSEVSSEQQRFLEFADRVTLWVGHSWLEYDYPALSRILGLSISDVWSKSLDTLILSRLFNYSDPHSAVRASGETGELEDTGYIGQTERRHSIDSYGAEFGIPKLEFDDFTRYSLEMEEYCVRDVDICYNIYLKYRSYIDNPAWKPSIELEHRFQAVVNALHTNGFAFNSERASRLLQKVKDELATLDGEIHEAYPPRLRLVREVHPKLTRYGTLHKGDFRFVKGGDLSEYSGDPFCRCEWVPFNPSSHKQLIDVLSMAGWTPVDKTATHLSYDRERGLDPEKREHLKKYGWKINETNLTTLPASAPKPARSLAKRILLESRRRTLTEWLSLVTEGRIHGRFYGIGAWTHRMAHQKPNTANIPNELDTSGNKKLLGKEMRSLWIAPKKRLLVGVDAEGIQLRVFAHYIDDKEFTDALVNGKKADKTDPHSLNQRILGRVCKSRAAAKRFIYALLLGAGLWKLSQILECSEAETKEALDRLLTRYTGWARLKKNDIPRDARRGFFIGLDGRSVFIPGSTVSERRHLATSGYLQNGEAVIMKLATTYFFEEMPDDCFLVNLVHDEWQTEVPNSISVAMRVAELQSKSLERAGKTLGLRCPLAGSYYNDELRDYTIGTNWSVTH